MSDAQSVLRCINRRQVDSESLRCLKRVEATFPFNGGMELIAHALAGTTLRGWIAIAVLVAVIIAVLVAVGIAWLLAYAD